MKVIYQNKIHYTQEAEWEYWCSKMVLEFLSAIQL